MTVEPSGPQSDETDVVAITTLTRMQTAYLRPAEVKAGVVSRRVLKDRIAVAAGTELAKMRQAGQTVSIRAVGTDRGKRIVTTAVASHEEARVR